MYFQAKEAQARQIAEMEQEQKLAKVMADLKRRDFVAIKYELVNILNHVNFKLKKKILFHVASYIETIPSNSDVRSGNYKRLIQKNT